MKSNKLVSCAAIVLAFGSANCFAGGFGLSLGYGMGQTKSDAKDIAANYYGSVKHTENSDIIAIEGLYEHDYEKDAQLGLKFGYSSWGKEELKAGRYSLKGTYQEFPVTAYYKYAPSQWNQWSISGGGGLAIGTAKVSGSLSDSVTKLYPFLAAGVEYKFNRNFGLGLDMRANIGASFKSEGMVIRDVSGLQGVLAAKLYF